MAEKTETKVVDEIPEHLDNGGSQITKRMNCPGSRLRELEFPNTTSEVAETGTRIHKYAEFVVDSEIKLTKKAYERNGGEPLEIKSLRSRVLTGARKLSAGEIPQDAEASELDFALDYSGHILKILQEHKCLMLDSFQYSLEKKVVLDLDLGLGGTIDFLAAYTDPETNKNILLLVDLKTGIRDASIDQLNLYACAAQKECGGIFHEAHCYVFQPLNQVAEHKYKSNSLLKDELSELTAMFLGVAQATFDEGAYDNLSAGSHCYFCRAKVGCPACLQQQHQSVAAVLAAEDGELSEDVPKVKEIKQKLPGIPVEDLVRLKSYEDVIKKTLDEVSSYLENLYDQGKVIEGIRVVQKTPRRSWNKTMPLDYIDKELRDKHGIRGVTEKKLKSLGEVEKLFKQKGVDKQTAKEIMSEYVEMSKPGTAVIYDPEGKDKRKDKQAVQLEQIDKLLDDAPK